MQLTSELRRLGLAATLLSASVVAGCAGAPGLAASTANARLVSGPPIQDIVTPFDEALTCIKGQIRPSIVFSVGAVVDQTGKESFTDGGVGKFVTQGAGDMVQSALFMAGTTLVNRRDPRVTTTEVEWQIRDPRRIVPTNFYVTGSINSLDFIPGSGAEVDVLGVGGRYRQNRMLVGLDLALTDASTGRIVANVPLHKQIFASEAGLATGRFFGDTLVLADIGGREREAINFALRQMLYLGTFELLTQLMEPSSYAECRAHIDRAHGFVDNTSTAQAVAQAERRRAPARNAALAAAATGSAAPAGRPASAEGMAASQPPASGTFQASNGGDEELSRQARAQAILASE